MKISDLVIGFGLVILGIIFLSENFGFIDIDFRDIWPLIIVLGGLGFWFGFFKDKNNYGLIMPGTIFIVYGLMFWYCTIQSWDYMQILWPVFLIGPGLGFYLMYLFGEREKGLLIPATILSSIGVLFIFSHTGIFRFWPVLLILFGFILIFRYRKSVKEEGGS
jgi:hypothetical protein